MYINTNGKTTVEIKATGTLLEGIKKELEEERVDYETARALMLLGMPQGLIINDKNIKRLGEPFYVTMYRENILHKYIPSLNIGHIHRHDVMCYAPTKEEACKWLLNKIKEEEEEK